MTLTPAPARPFSAGMAQPAQHHRKRREPEVGLGLATARREEQQVHRSAIGIARVGKSREIQKEKRYLEGVPARSFDSETLAERPGHSAVRHAERIQRVRILFQHRDSPLDPVGGNTSKAQEFLSSLAATSFQGGDGRSLRLDPRSILVHKRTKLCLNGGTIDQRPERLHRELDARHSHGRRFFHLGARYPCTAELSARAIHELPFRRDAVARWRIRAYRRSEDRRPDRPSQQPVRRACLAAAQRDGRCVRQSLPGIQRRASGFSSSGVRLLTRKTETERVP